MEILIIGGTRFLGRALVESAQERGHTVTLFNRGQSDPEAFPELETLIGDRDGGLAPLKGRTWDAVIDTCGYFPRIVRQSAEMLADAVGRYAFISSISVYADVSAPGVDETDPVGTIEDETLEEITNESYGPLKALCEAAVTEIMGAERALNLRPGLIVGAYDRSDRFTYWPHRVAEGGRVLVPGSLEQPVQFIDVKDVADFTILALEKSLSGAYNVDSQPWMFTLGDVLETARDIAGSDAKFVTVDEAFLMDQGVGPWMEMPLWIPSTDAESGGFMAVDCSKAAEAGLTIRPLAETVQDTLDWAQSRPVTHEWRAGMKREREQDLLAQWDAVRSEDDM